MILELCLESVFAVVDMFFVSKLENSQVAIATVGLTESILTLVYTLGIGLSTGATAIVARRTGEKDIEGASHSAVQALMVTVALSILISILGIIYAPQLLTMMGARSEVVSEGVGFTRIMMGSSILIILLFMINGIFRGAGNPLIAMKSLWLASILNILLCPIMIFVLDFGLEGAAIATAIGRSAGVMYQLYWLKKGSSQLDIKTSYFQWDKKLSLDFIQLSWPATLQFFIQSGSWVFMAYLVSRTGSTEATAGYQIAIRNIVFFILPAWGLSNAAATLVGQNLGAKQADRAEKSVILTTWYNSFFMALVMLLFLFFSQPIVGIFSTDAQVLNYAVQALQIIGSGYIFYGIGMVMVQALNGAGDTRTPTWINLIGFWLFQIPLAWILAVEVNWGPTGAFVAVPVAETLVALLAWYYFKLGKWKEVQV
ncbi:MAG: MATE family efflux transporter [Saprospiraceae bacterium]|nr:MATE family efflux transporter [Saprospiraceae bacterium]